MNTNQAARIMRARMKSVKRQNLNQLQLTLSFATLDGKLILRRSMVSKPHPRTFHTESNFRQVDSVRLDFAGLNRLRSSARLDGEHVYMLCAKIRLEVTVVVLPAL